MKLYIDNKEIAAFRRTVSTICPFADFNQKVEEKAGKIIRIGKLNGGIAVEVNPQFTADMLDALSNHFGVLFAMGQAAFHAVMTMAESITKVLEKYKEEEQKQEESEWDDLLKF